MASGYDRHHVYHPRSAYRGETERRFRNLKCHIVYIPRVQHNEIHATYGPPKKPSPAFMRAKLELHKRRKCPICHRR